jgi:hypothetical protein
VSNGFNPLPNLFYLRPKEGKMSGWPEFELKDFQELGLDLLKNLPHFVGVLDKVSIGAESRSFMWRSWLETPVGYS